MSALPHVRWLTALYPPADTQRQRQSQHRCRVGADLHNRQAGPIHNGDRNGDEIVRLAAFGDDRVDDLFRLRRRNIRLHEWLG